MIYMNGLLTPKPGRPRGRIALIAGYIISALLLVQTTTAAGNEAEAQMQALRERAAAAEAPNLAPREWQRGEKYAARANAAAAEGKADKAVRDFSRAAEEYAAAEIVALQAATLGSAYDAREQARAARAGRYAPLTLKLADQQIEAAEGILARDPYAQAEAATLAAEAEFTALKAAAIAAVAADKPTSEELLLRQEALLRQLEAAAGLAPADSTGNAAAVTRLAAEIERLRSSERQLRADLADSQAFTAALEEEIRALDAELGGASQERRKLVMKLEEQARMREQFAQAEALFGPEEAVVFQQSDTIVVRVLGLEFPSGSAELGPGNQALMNKIKSVIEIYPQSLLLVEGHTDSRGSDRINKILSLQRAQTVANYIISQMGVSAARLTAVGYGAERPIANNETEEGRRKNRRIDLLITPSDRF
jgi:outer membrane protein OmpA-like peptidoglycan-associated protein